MKDNLELYKKIKSKRDSWDKSEEEKRNLHNDIYMPYLRKKLNKDWMILAKWNNFESEAKLEILFTYFIDYLYHLYKGDK